MKIARICLSATVLLLCVLGTSNAQQTPSQTNNADPILAMLDSLVKLDYFKRSAWAQDTIGKLPADSVPPYNSALIKKRLQKLNEDSPFNLVHNKHVESYIGTYAIRGRRQTSKMLGLSERFFPLFEEKLDKYDLPQELKYLAIVESALNPSAKSRAGATGLWQFMYLTGKMYNLKVNSYIDERRDPVKSTEAACEYFSHLYKIYGDWSLVLAAYNAGPGNVNKAIRKAGGKMDYWQIQPYLPRETRGYVPAFIAVTYIMSYAEEHNIRANPLREELLMVDSVTVRKRMNFDQLSAGLGVSKQTLRLLNPVYKLNEIPASKSRPYVLYLPFEKTGDFIAMQQSNYTPPAIASNDPNAGMISREVTTTHTVRSGEFLGVIAKKYKCSVSDIQRWNNMASTKIYPGQQLDVKMVVMEPATLASNKANTKNNTSTVKDKKYVYYTVQRGDTLWEIAKRFEGVSVTSLKELNGNVSAYGLQPGQKIKLHANGS